MGLVSALVAVVIPRVIILYAWLTDSPAWNAAFGSPIVPILGFIFLPWTTFFFVIFSAAEVGFDLFRLLVMFVAVMADLGTWGFGSLATRRRLTSDD